ncbi:MAG TPA: hypothetical protein VGL99_28715 [Chloroflexota bacterium]
MTFLLLVIQAGNALLASLVQGAIGGPSALAAALAGVLGLWALAIASLRGAQSARRVVGVVEVAMLLGTLPRLLQAAQAQQWPDGVWLVTNVGLPLVVLTSLRVALQPGRSLAAMLLLVSSLVHLGLVREHAGGLGLLFLIDGVLLAALGVLLLRTVRWRKMSTWLIAGNLVAYLVAVGPGGEAVDSLGLTTKLLEVVALGLLVLPDGAARRRRWVLATAGVIGATFVTGAVTWASEARAGKVGSHIHVAASAPAPTYAQRVAATELVAATRAGIAMYEDEAVARRAGYEPSGPRVGNQHYVNHGLEHDGRVLDPQHPEGLVYVDTTLVGALFQMPRLGEIGPQPGGTITHWHTHDNICIGLAGLGLATPFGACPPFSIGVAAPAMMHIWTIDNPGGPFADELDPAFVRRLAHPVL